MGEIVEVIGIILEEEILSEVNKSPLYSIILDEATDITVTKQLGVSIPYLDNNAVVRTRNLKLLEIINGTADVITETVILYLTSKTPVTLDIRKLAGGATDGASVMVGCEHGVVTRIKQVVPTFITTPCSAHRLSLATCDASDASTMIQDSSEF
ncbi:Zinc finger protein [Oopsacas minuta]|uniref:Zinc finger protein n=1 Tax=Oopsacas minuta TaxID=111878 RepID=A0AAV7KG66_9METZ|nr:Zinc finger protein [Oopsacas minuta]